MPFDPAIESIATLLTPLAITLGILRRLGYRSVSESHHALAQGC